MSPLYADLSGLPATLIQVGSAETLLSDAARLADRLGSADLAVTIEVWPKMIRASPIWNALLERGGERALWIGACIYVLSQIIRCNMTKRVQPDFEML